MSKRPSRQEGFTLVELLIVVIIIAILAAIAIPVYLGQRDKASDAAAKSVVRSAMIAMESVYTDTADFTAIATADLRAIEPSLAYVDAANAASSPTARADANSVNWHATGERQYEVGSLSASGKGFGVAVSKDPGGGNTYYVGGVVKAW